MAACQKFAVLNLQFAIFNPSSYRPHPGPSSGIPLPVRSGFSGALDCTRPDCELPLSERRIGRAKLMNDVRTRGCIYKRLPLADSDQKIAIRMNSCLILSVYHSSQSRRTALHQRGARARITRGARRYSAHSRSAGGRPAVRDRAARCLATLIGLEAQRPSQQVG